MFRHPEKLNFWTVYQLDFLDTEESDFSPKNIKLQGEKMENWRETDVFISQKTRQTTCFLGPKTSRGKG